MLEQPSSQGTKHAQHVQETLFAQSQLIIHLAPDSRSAVGVLAVRHCLVFPDAIEVPSAATASLLASPLYPRVWTRVSTRCHVQDRQTALLRVDAEIPRQRLRDLLLQPGGPALAGHVPDARVDEARVAPVDGDVAVLGVEEQTALELGEPDLVAQLAVLVELDAADAGVVLLAVPVLHVELAQVVEAGRRADDARLRRASERWEQTQDELDVPEEVDLREFVSRVSRFGTPGQRTEWTSSNPSTVFRYFSPFFACSSGTGRLAPIPMLLHRRSSA